MPRQNRVTPEGKIIAAPTRGTFMGNRGILHNAAQEIVKPYAHKAWIICRLRFKGRRRKLMQPGNYTELFFLDEATALAAGHRPCFECRRPAAQAFRDAWLAGNPELSFGESIRANEMDAVLHKERLTTEFYVKNKTKRTFTAELVSLPNGAFVLVEERPYLLWNEALLLWTAAGYTSAQTCEGIKVVEVLTPASTVAALAQGYKPTLHPSAQI